MATIRKRQLKTGGNAYTVQVKFKDKGSGKTILETTTWRPDAKMTAKQEERAVQTFAEEFESQIKATVNRATATGDTPNITFREFAAQWLEKTKRDCSLNYYVKARDSISLANEYIGGYSRYPKFLRQARRNEKENIKGISETRISFRIGKTRLQLYEAALRGKYTELHACKCFRGKSRQ